jgi:hypothetical protein
MSRMSGSADDIGVSQVTTVDEVEVERGQSAILKAARSAVLSRVEAGACRT